MNRLTLKVTKLDEATEEHYRKLQLTMQMTSLDIEQAIIDAFNGGAEVVQLVAEGRVLATLERKAIAGIGDRMLQND